LQALLTFKTDASKEGGVEPSHNEHCRPFHAIQELSGHRNPWYPSPIRLLADILQVEDAQLPKLWNRMKAAATNDFD
jgi:hypothetical protein